MSITELQVLEARLLLAQSFYAKLNLELENLRG